MKKIVNFLVAFVALALFVPTTPEMVGVALPLYAGGAALITFMPQPKMLFNGFMPKVHGLDVEVWTKYIVEKFRKTNEFMFKAKNESNMVLGGKVVHIPQAGSSATVIKNRSSFPGTAVRRTDTEVTYTLESYSTDPVHIPWEELETLSYDKLDSVIGEQTAELAEVVADDLLIKWSPVSTEFVLTTGGPTALTEAAASGQVGTRKAFHQKDLQKAMVAMNKGNVPKAGRIALIDDHMYAGFYDSLTDSQLNAYQQFADNKSGIVGRLHGFDIYTRSSVLAYASGNTVKALGSALAATDNLASICWHPDCVTYAMGDMKPFTDKDNPLYYGDLYSSIVRMGGRQKRADRKGVIAIVQAV